MELIARPRRPRPRKFATTACLSHYVPLFLVFAAIGLTLVKPCLLRAPHAGVADELRAGAAAVALVVAAAEAVEAGGVAGQEPQAVLALVEAARRALQALALQQEAPRGAREAPAHRAIPQINRRKINKASLTTNRQTYFFLLCR